MSEQGKLEVTMYTLSSGKKVYFREPKIIDSENAAKAASKESDGDQTILMMLAQKEMLKILMVQVDEARMTALTRNNLDSVFSYKEYNEVQTCLQHFVSDGDKGNLKLTPELKTL